MFYIFVCSSQHFFRRSGSDTAAYSDGVCCASQLGVCCASQLGRLLRPLTAPTLMRMAVSFDYVSITAITTENFFAKLRTTVSPPNLAPFGFKLCQNAFQTIPHISFFDVENSCSQFFLSKIVFRHFCQDLEELQPNGPQNQIPHEILL